MGCVRADEAEMRGLPGDSESGENPIMLNNSFKPTPLAMWLDIRKFKKKNCVTMPGNG
jgi:hypothetical protein